MSESILLPDTDVAAVQEWLDEAWASYQRHYAVANGAHSAVYPGVVEGLHALQGRGLALACVTNKPLAFARDLLHAKGLAPFFAQVFGGDSFARSKPDPLPLIETCRALASRHCLEENIGPAARAAAPALVAVQDDDLLGEHKDLWGTWS